MPKISAVIIAKNEEKNIARCIRSLQNVADEVLVLDNGSIDKTVDLAKDLNARVEITEWKGYSATKNHGNNLAQFDYILSIDADEALSMDLAKSITEIKESLNENTAYKFNRLTNYCGSWIRHCGWYPDTKLRLWHRQKVEWQGDIHEEIVLDKAVSQKHLNGNLLHYSYYTKTDHYKQAHKFTTLTAKEAFEKGKKASVLKLVFAPIVKFIKSYILQMGFLDGGAGFQVCRISAYATFMKYQKLRNLHKNS